jgi:hypothetical protein
MSPSKEAEEEEGSIHFLEFIYKHGGVF